MTEAKDWAGELISGQTTTGRILVSLLLDYYAVFSHVKYVRSLERCVKRDRNRNTAVQ